MLLQGIDWLILVAFFAVSLGIGLYSSRQSSKNINEFFKAGGNLPWWILGTSMVATTFSTDTPNLITDIVRKNGISGNWVWWSFLLTGMLTVFFFAKLWKRSGVLTDIEFYELRYSGKAASFLRGFRAIFLGLFFNVVIISGVSLAAIKIGGVLLGISPIATLLISGVVTVIYSSLGGLRGVVFTDFIQFILSLAGAIAAAWVAVNHPAVGGLENLVNHELIVDKLNFIPDLANREIFLTIFLIPLFIQWWSVWYPGSEPGGGGFIVQRMLAAKDEKNALSSVMFFTIVHYAIRPWPWILVALCSIIVFPDMASLQAAFPNADASIVQDDMAYPAMLSFMPVGIMGLVVTSLVAAYMSTLSTMLNLGASYMVNDFYLRFIKPDSTQKHLVAVGRIATVLIMVLGGYVALHLENALQTFSILLQIGAGTGLIYILRWYWWRINAMSEIVAMAASFLTALYFAFIHHNYFEEFATHEELIVGILVTTVCWVSTAYLSTPTEKSVLISFVKKTKAPGPGWRRIHNLIGSTGEKVDTTGYFDFQAAILAFGAGVIGVYSFLFGTGNVLLGDMLNGILLIILAIVAFGALFALRKRF
ncbi:sodium:solute symporter family protein [Cyclobacterium qasimii]|uniref:Sodium/glucose cotransporter n=2 Tax=Cyclobacterium qasimii TaxID=1350429 RepID=A0A512CHG0_9BACT|nr:sodium:solute symporter family protein [Cyclobacterium qasimii]EPR71478.1 putative sodium-solute symporter [Cyclobacterium qasimii M12-11B]GEO23658.1 sodium/glucose cotransporter [Cyclobacterium qasimii]